MKYSLEFLPIAEADIRGIALYIAHELSAPVAATNLIREIRGKANSLRDMPYMYREYFGEPRNETVYRAMPVKNYIVFYTVCEESKTALIHRILYARMNVEVLL
jgi:plasmid stabilization system protein ParE